MSLCRLDPGVRRGYLWERDRIDCDLAACVPAQADQLAGHLDYSRLTVGLIHALSNARVISL
jgi:hypothetical protein